MIGIREKADPERSELIVDVGIVNDLAGQIDRTVREARPRLVRVIHGAIHAVAEAELAREVQCQSPRCVRVACRFDAIDQVAVIALCQLSGDSVLEIETLPEYQWWHAGDRRAAAAHAARRATSKYTGTRPAPPTRGGHSSFHSHTRG